MGRAAAHARDQPAMNLADQSLGDRPAVVQIIADEFESVAIVQKFARIVRIGLRHRLSREQSLRLLQRQMRALDMRRVVRFQKQRPRAHRRKPIIRELRRIEKSPRPLYSRQTRRYAVADSKRRLKPAGIVHPVTATPSGTRTRPVRRSFMRPDLSIRDF